MAGGAAIDPQVIGWRDDGSESGLLRTGPVHGNLVAVPIRASEYVRTLSGGGTAAFQTGQYQNPDGTGNALRMQVSASGDGVRIWFPFRGSTFGIRYLSPSTALPLTVSVDGEAVAVDLQETEMAAEPVTVDLPTGTRITHRDLDPSVLHYAELTLVYTDATLTVTLYGFLLDQGAGYVPAPRRLYARTYVNVTTTGSNLNAVSGAHIFGGINQIIYVNTTGAEIVVTITDALGGNTVALITVPANGMETFTLPGCVEAARLWYHQAAATGVRATIIGETL